MIDDDREAIPETYARIARLLQDDLETVPYESKMTRIASHLTAMLALSAKLGETFGVPPVALAKLLEAICMKMQDDNDTTLNNLEENAIADLVRGMMGKR